ncbi:poly-beta-1,6-N-acetyl-D-glucosamine biosynthesis protein PgaD [Ectobacillus funiculus]|uniref:Poly-beta-1,6-N-acetyl-D-glucosamine biosynthesis protein PgaD n=1 Tax=Ectobacillus funiculus TaxID=137993 RepID=A0ABV5WAM7_9BACI
MGKSRPRRKRKHRGIIIHKERPLVIKSIELLVTVFLWLYLLSILTLVVAITWDLDFEWKRILLVIFQIQAEDVQNIIYKIGMFSVIFFIIQFVWVQYNYRMFGGLKRRRFPKDVQPQDLAQYFSFTEEEIQYLQENDIIKLKDTIV